MIEATVEPETFEPFKCSTHGALEPHQVYVYKRRPPLCDLRNCRLCIAARKKAEAKSPRREKLTAVQLDAILDSLNATQTPLDPEYEDRNAWPPGTDRRPCLKCEEPFLSDGKHNRICRACRTGNAQYSGSLIDPGDIPISSGTTRRPARRHRTAAEHDGEFAGQESGQ